MIQRFANFMVGSVFNIDLHSRLGESLSFFIYDVIKILMLLSIMIFIISFIRSYFSPEKTKKILSRTNKYVGNVLASLLGVVTPFCSCSSVPIFIGFVESGISLGTTFSFLITSPIVNEVAIVMLFTMFGPKIAILYVSAGVLIGIIGGIIIDKLHLEDEVESYVYSISIGETPEIVMTIQDRIAFAKANVVDIIKKVWPYVIVGIGVGAWIHGYAPEDLLTRYAGEGNLLAVPVAVIVGIPLYSNAAGTIPIAEALMGKGVSAGTALSFMMSVTALSLPSIIILRRVLKPRLIKIFVALVTLSIILVGYLFNLII